MSKNQPKTKEENPYENVKGWQLSFEKPKPKFLQKMGFAPPTQEQEIDKKRVCTLCVVIL